MLAAWKAAASPSTGNSLARLSGEFGNESARLEDDIQKLAGQPLNPGSPKQIGDVLFGSMGLPGGTKTKTGHGPPAPRRWKT